MITLLNSSFASSGAGMAKASIGIGSVAAKSSFLGQGDLYKAGNRR
jgi:hypothetical protein